jgi:hypothetical protein
VHRYDAGREPIYVYKVTISNKDIKEPKELPPELRGYEDYFSKKSADELPTFDYSKHAIDTIEPPLYGPLYSLS